MAPDRAPNHRRGAPRWVPERLADSSAVNRVIIVAAVLAVLIFAAWGISRGALGLFGDPDSSGTAAPTASATVSASPSSSRKAVGAPGSKASAKEGSLQFAAAKVRGQAGKDVVTVTLKNLGTSWAPFYGESQFLVGEGQQRVRGVPSLYYLEPNEAATTTLTFYVPGNFKATKVELHAEPASTGVDVALA